MSYFQYPVSVACGERALLPAIRKADPNTLIVADGFIFRTEHHVDARISIHALEGRIRVRMSVEFVDVSSGELIALDDAIPHDVEAIEESAFLLTISWPGVQRRNAMRGSKACRDQILRTSSVDWLSVSMEQPL